MEYDLSDIDMLVNDRQKFNEFVYTPLNEAVKELERRRSCKNPDVFSTKLFPADIPKSFLGDRPKGFLFRHLATPNYETIRFMSLVDGINKLEPLVLEIQDDKFTSNNKLKYFLGRVGFYHGINKSGKSIISRKTIIDFSKYDGKKISEVETLSGQRLTDFHHELFKKNWSIEKYVFNLSDEKKLIGASALNYYNFIIPFLVLHGILFENFLLEDNEESSFTAGVFLPVFLQVYKLTGLKPLVVALDPTEIEGEDFWLCYTPETINYIKTKEAVVL